jgi:hypothetical protein
MDAHLSDQTSVYIRYSTAKHTDQHAHTNSNAHTDQFTHADAGTGLANGDSIPAHQHARANPNADALRCADSADADGDHRIVYRVNPNGDKHVSSKRNRWVFDCDRRACHRDSQRNRRHCDLWRHGYGTRTHGNIRTNS